MDFIVNMCFYIMPGSIRPQVLLYHVILVKMQAISQGEVRFKIKKGKTNTPDRNLPGLALNVCNKMQRIIQQKRVIILLCRTYIFHLSGLHILKLSILCKHIWHNLFACICYIIWRLSCLKNQFVSDKYYNKEKED